MYRSIVVLSLLLLPLGCGIGVGVDNYTCPEGHCQQLCEGDSCPFTCSGGWCNQDCAAGANCDFTCSGSSSAGNRTRLIRLACSISTVADRESASEIASHGKNPASR